MVFVTTDPARDTPSVIQTWLSHFSASFTGLTGTIAQIRDAETAIGMPFVRREIYISGIELRDRACGLRSRLHAEQSPSGVSRRDHRLRGDA